MWEVREEKGSAEVSATNDCEGSVASGGEWVSHSQRLEWPGAVVLQWSAGPWATLAQPSPRLFMVNARKNSSYKSAACCCCSQSKIWPASVVKCLSAHAASPLSLQPLRYELPNLPFSLPLQMLCPRIRSQHPTCLSPYLCKRCAHNFALSATCRALPPARCTGTARRKTMSHGRHGVSTIWSRGQEVGRTVMPWAMALQIHRAGGCANCDACLPLPVLPSCPAPPSSQLPV